ncbi:MAG: flagellinolysin, partial [Gammaproteobacteria bacterium]
AEDRVYQYYGIRASGGPKLEVKLLETGTGGDGAGGVLAYISSSYSGGQLASQSLNIDMDDFRPPKLPNGGTAPYFNDRIIAHEMVHAYMARTMNLPALTAETNDNGSSGTVGGWFTEGTAEFIQGADERLANDLVTTGGAAALVAKLGDDTVEGIYSAGYAAVRYLHAELLSEGVEGGIKGIMTYLAGDSSRTLSQAIDNVSTRWNSLAAFETSFASEGAAFIGSMNLGNADTGAIGGLDADGGPTYTAQSVLPNARSINEDPTTLDILFPTLASLQESGTVGFQVGANGGEQIAIKFTGFGTTNLGIAGLDVRSDPVQAVVSIDNALKYISRSRADMGAAQNRLLSTVANLGNVSENLSAARSRIQDADFAAETVQLTRSSILQRSGTAVLAQANSLPRAVLALLR